MIPSSASPEALPVQWAPPCENTQFCPHQGLYHYTELGQYAWALNFLCEA